MKPEIISAVAGGSLGIHGMCLGPRLRLGASGADGQRAMTGLGCLNMPVFGQRLGGH